MPLPNTSKLATAEIIDGKAIAEDIKNNLKILIDSKIGQNKRHPGLAVILVGDDPASHFYVGSKQKACSQVGIISFKTVLPASTAKDKLLDVIDEYNYNKEVDGILLQLPLPEKLKESTQEILDRISPDKDVDGLSTINLGRLMSFSPQAIYPCTPKGCMELLKRSNVVIQGKKAVVIGRSILVGKALSIMLNQANATVTMAHSKTENIEKEILEADILVVAIGKTKFIKGEYIKSGAVVLDVGINAEMINLDGVQIRKLFGDVDFETAKLKASKISPVPGGVGPMTVAMLLDNTWELYLRQIQKSCV